MSTQMIGQRRAPRTAMVTGAAGFIGSHLTEALLSRGDEVVGVDSLTDYYDPEQKRRNLAPLLSHPRFTLLEQSLTDPEPLAVAAGVDTVFHQAGQPGVRLSWSEYFGTYVERNVVTTQRLLEAVQGGRARKVVFASSSSVYGNQPAYPCTEAALPTPYSPYGVTKLAAEHLCGLYARNFGIPTVSLRYFTVYGPRQRPDMAFSIFLRNALEGRPVTVTGDGEQVRDFTYVGDIVRANLAAADADVVPGSVFNVCGRESVTVNRVLDLMGECLGTPVQRERIPVVAGDVERTGGSSRMAEEHLGWQAQTSLADGIAAQVAWESARVTAPV
ncbi:UDP-glucose 4-epimerase [Marmoricola endophyticus]|uniref:UDP-glucose 4-epimerase n=1 Tax=Marmoricola endophyticus TaxID=2040280 RepID=A0A917F411_9ACTN|nr:NAD-dependent epimerase/dehydratase family protein [Marmoricola endophyticus]GGF43642.1 UDP-glucose 4-epimerase [Marmoricola endophyticus]